jgi:hypothetical protein
MSLLVHASGTDVEFALGKTVLGASFVTFKLACWRQGIVLCAMAGAKKKLSKVLNLVCCSFPAT